MKHAELIQRMVREQRPVRPVKSALLAALWGVGSAVAVLALNAMLFSSRPDFSTVLRSPQFILPFLSLLGILFSVAHRAATSALPGRPSAPWAGIVLWTSVVGLFVGLGLAMWHDPRGTDWVAGMDPAGRVCSIEFAVLAVVPVLVLFWSLRSLAPRDPARTGRLMGLAAGAAAALGLCIDCNNGTPLHQVIWHLVPAALLVLVCWLIGRRWLRW